MAPVHVTGAWTRRWFVAAWLLAGAFLLLANLGTYALWDDEANTALFARNLWRFGDLTAWDGTNLVAFRDGLELTGLKNRVYPPFQYAWAAPWLGLLGETPLAARLPFALAALAGLGLWAWWISREETSPATWGAWTLAVFGNVSLFLYSRQSRYYALAWALTLALAWLYEHREDSRRNRWLLACASTVLLSVHYLSWGAAMVCLAADQVLFQWRRDSNRQRAAFLASQLLSLVVVVGTFFPFGRKVTDYVPRSWAGDKLKLAWWNLRDLAACEFMWAPVLLLAVVVTWTRRDRLLLRAVVALLAYALTASLLSVQPVGWARVADIRYMVAAIPLGLFITVRAFTSLPRVPPWVGVALVALVSLTTALHVPAARWMGVREAVPLRSTTWTWLRELASPQRSAYGEATQWLNAHVPAGARVLVLPDFAAYPVMFHSPQLSVMWQLRPDQREAYAMLPEHLFRGQGAPDVLVAFGGGEARALASLTSQYAARGSPFGPPVRLDVAAPDRTRPELIWRDFATVAPAADQGVFIYARQGLVTP